MSEHVSDTVARVASYLENLGAFTHPNESAFFAKRGSTVVAIHVLPWEDDAMVHVEADVVEGATLNAPLLHKLLSFNANSAYGAFGISECGTITVHHCLLGSSLTEEELLPVVQEVAKIADDWDDVIRSEAGGKRAIDRLAERSKPRLQPTIEPPQRKE